MNIAKRAQIHVVNLKMQIASQVLLANVKESAFRVRDAFAVTRYIHCLH